METESITVDPLAKVKRLSFTDLTRAGKAGAARGSMSVYGELKASEGLRPTAPDSLQGDVE